MASTNFLEGNKILFLDIETAPNLSHLWGAWEQNALDFVSNWYIMCFSAKIGNKHVTKALPDYPNYTPGSENDYELVKEIKNLLEEVELVCWQNGDEFDGKKINTRLIYWNLGPPSPYKTIDTKKIAKRYFAFNSNGLNNLGEFLGLGRKMKHEGYELWQKCMQGDLKAWARMKKYNKQDTLLLEKLYLKLRPWVKDHWPVNRDKLGCPKCGSEDIQRRGFAYTRAGTYARIWCKSCLGWSRCSENIQLGNPLVSI